MTFVGFGKETYQGVAPRHVTAPIFRWLNGYRPATVALGPNGESIRLWLFPAKARPRRKKGTR